MPYKVFAVNEILTAADVQEYLADQSVMTFASSAARASAIGTAVEGMVTYLEDTDQLEVYGGTAVGWSSARNSVLGSAVAGDTLTYDGTDWVNAATPGDNLLYNGAMQVAQRGTSETGITSGGYYTADRWNAIVSSLGTWTNTVEADGPTGSGFTKSFKMECTTADATPAAASQVNIRHYLEGQDVQALKKGTASAESLTLSFWVKSNVTGTYIVNFIDHDNSRVNAGSYTIDSADTWEKKTITIDGDTTGVLDNDNALSFEASFWLAAGSNSTSGTLPTAWEAYTQANRAVGQTNLAASTSNYWQVTGVQLETGTVATGFDHKPYGVELAECQRYYQVFKDLGSPQANYAASRYGTNNITFTVPLATPMRTTTPVASTGTFQVRGGGNIDTVTPSFLGIMGNSAIFNKSALSFNPATDEAFMASTSNDFDFDAEL